MNLVTGATGHVGNVLVRELLTRGQDVRALILPGENTASLDGLPIQRVVGDVTDPASLERAMQGVEVVYHVAGVISLLPGSEEPMRRVNVDGVYNIAEAALKTGVRRLVHVSSIHAFERLPHGFILDEHTPFAPATPAGAYDRTKAQGTLTLLAAVRRGLDAVVVCPTGIIGPNDYFSSHTGRMILDFTRRKLHFLIDGAFDFVDVRDVAAGLIQACERGQPGEVYILAGTRVRLTEIKWIVQEVIGVRTPEVLLPFTLADCVAGVAERWSRLTRRVPYFTRYALRTVRENSVCSCTKAQQELGYHPRPLRDTIVDTLAWWRSYRPGVLPDRP